MTIPEADSFTVSLLSSADLAFYIGSGEVPDALARAFAGAQFNDEFAPGRPLEHTVERVLADDDSGLAHVVAWDVEGKLIGAIFCVPARNPHGAEACEIGWMFLVPELPLRLRMLVLGSMLDLALIALHILGYRRVETSMGTPAGAKVLRRFGFRPNPYTSGENSWVMNVVRRLST